METRTINWLSLSCSQKAKLVNQARTHLQQQVSGERFCRLFAKIYQIDADMNEDIVLEAL